MDESAYLGQGDEVHESDWPTFEEHLARNLHLSGPDLQGTLDAIVTAALGTVPEADFAGLIVLERRRLVPQVTLGEPPHELDLLQQRLGAGPCIEAAATQVMICIDDARIDERWREFAERAVVLGVLSVLCVPLWVSGDTLGTLSLYSRRASVLQYDNVQSVKLLATHAALALANSRKMTDLRTALVNRDLIGQAKGILMERLRITADDAFGLLSASSQSKNRKLVDVARGLVETGQLET